MQTQNLRFQMGLTRNGNIAVLSPDNSRSVISARDGSTFHFAQFPDHVLIVNVEAVDVAEALRLFEPAQAVASYFAAEKADTKAEAENNRNRQYSGWQLQLAAFSKRVQKTANWFRAQSKRLGERDTIAEARTRFTAHQWRTFIALNNPLRSGRNGKCVVEGTSGMDHDYASAVARRIADLRYKKRKLGHGAPGSFTSRMPEHRKRAEAMRKARRTAAMKRWPKLCGPHAHEAFELKRLPDADLRRVEKEREFAAEIDRRHKLAERRAKAAAKRKAFIVPIVLHIGDRAALAAGVRGELQYGHALASLSEKRGRRWRTVQHCAPGVRLDSKDNIILEGTHGRKPSIIGKLPALALLKSITLSESHPVGLFCAPLAEMPGVFACFGSEGKKWVVVGYSLAGHRVPECVATGTITLADIDAEANAEVQRLLIERYGTDRYLSGIGAAPVQEDEYGRLYALPGGHKVARLLNSTTNPDGTINEYWLPVPAHMRTAHEAVAWSFGCTVEQYQPSLQS